MNTYGTSEIAKMIGIHPNTVRMYEDLQLIPQAKRKENGYRVFTDFHIRQLKLARAAFRVEIMQNGLRKRAVDIIKTSAAGEFDEALALTEKYEKQLEEEKKNAEEAIGIVKKLLAGNSHSEAMMGKRKEVSQALNISMDTLRNWEMNGLLTVKRRANGYRVYTEEDVRRLKIIRVLRCANYSLASILRMLNALSADPGIDIKGVIGMYGEGEDIITACDNLLISLDDAIQNALYMKKMISEMKNNLPLCKEMISEMKNNPPL